MYFGGLRLYDLYE